jgi:hypothetical protein
MSVSFIGELNEIVIFRPATAHPEPITLIKVTKVNYFCLDTLRSIPDRHFPSHQADQGAPAMAMDVKNQVRFRTAYFKFHVLEQVKKQELQ